MEWMEWKLETSVELWMPAHMFQAGDPCSCKVTVLNVEPEPLVEYPLFVILDVFSEYFFAPSFGEYDNYLADYTVFPVGFTEVEVLPLFDWPEGAGSINGILWYAALTDPEITSLFGEMDTWSFGWDS